LQFSRGDRTMAAKEIAMSVSRRQFLGTAPAAVVPALWSSSSFQAPGPPTGTGAIAGSLAATFPTQAPELAREMVGASHANLSRVKELLARHPTLARASWDWGFGDWEDALGAASHVGNREIADLLIANGARPTIFSAAMLGQLDVVKAFIAASPGIETIHGPHSITLFRHATAGGARAQAVADYLATLPGADKRPAVQPISAEDMSALAGEYVYGSGADDRIIIALGANGLTFLRKGRNALRLTHLGDRLFHPPGAIRVQIRFRSTAAGTLLSVYDPDVVLEAAKS
jgi:hypothetical protein